MNNRESERYNLDKLKGGLNVFWEADVEGVIKGQIVDLSLEGIGIMAKGLNDLQIDNLKSLDEVFITLHFGKESLLIGVKNIWNSIKRDENVVTYMGGTKINIISSEDRLKLLSYIKKYRN